MTQDGQLREKILERSARIVVIGLGYVGIPVALKLAEHFTDVVGFDIDHEKVDSLNAGHYPIKGNEPDIQGLLDAVGKRGTFRATTNPEDLHDRDIYIVVVDTPLNEHKTPVYHRLCQALRTIAPMLQKSNLVIIESTIGPNAIEKVIVPALVLGSGWEPSKNEIFLVHCPERVMVGKLLQNLVHYDRVVGGYTPEATMLALALYETFVSGQLDPTDMVTAALVKTTENTYRDMEIAFANMLAKRCDELGCDCHEVRTLVNCVEGRNIHEAGAGVGGHCIPKEGYLFKDGSDLEDVHLTVNLARRINDSMPDHMVTLALRGLKSGPRRNTCISQLRWVVLGVAFLADTDDTRDAPTWPLLVALDDLGVTAVIHDPFVAPYSDQSLPEVLNGADCILVMTAHTAYRELSVETIKMLAPGAVLVDGRHVFDKREARRCGLTYLGVGNTC